MGVTILLLLVYIGVGGLCCDYTAKSACWLWRWPRATERDQTQMSLLVE